MIIRKRKKMSKVKMSKELIVNCRTKEDAVMLWNWYKKNGYVNNKFGSSSDKSDKGNFICLASNHELFTISKSEGLEYWDTVLPEGKIKVIYASDVTLKMILITSLQKSHQKQPSTRVPM